MSESFDVVFHGIDTEAPNSQASRSNIAKALKMEEEELFSKLQAEGSLVIQESVSLEIARKYQAGIMRLGGICNYRPAVKTGLSLELEPIKEEPEEFRFSCPACNFRKKFKTAEELPYACPQCGVIPNKYDKVSAIKEERERIKRRLLSQQKIREQEAQKLNERKEADAREKHLEEEIRRELGLPKAIDTRWKLFGSAAAIWVLGIAMGGGGFSYFNQLMDKGKPTSASAGKFPQNPEEMMTMMEKMQNLSPQVESFQEVLALSDGGMPFEGMMPSASETDAKSEPALLSTLDGKPIARLDAASILRAMANDKEWDIFLASTAASLIKTQQPAKAYQVADTINSPSLKIAALGKLAEYYQQNKQTTERDNLINTMTVYVSSLPDIVDRIDSQGAMALLLNNLGDSKKAGKFQDIQEKLAQDLVKPEDKATGLARLASNQARAGKSQQADVNFRQANALIATLGDKQKQLLAFAKLASSYAESGNRTLAMAIMNQALNNANQVKDSAARDLLIGEIALELARIGDADSALAAVQRLDPIAKEKALFNLTCELAYADRLYDAMKGLDKIATPEYKARAAALVSRMQSSHQDMSLMAVSVREGAIAAEGKILLPQDQAIVRSEMARYLAHGGQAQAAEEWSKKALMSAVSMEFSLEKDATVSLLAANLARANQSKLARDSLKYIKDPNVAANTEKEITKIGGIFGI